MNGKGRTIIVPRGGAVRDYPHEPAAPDYAQAREDREIDAFFGGRQSGFYVDIGAHDGIQYSNTLLFYERGWRGINVEPNPATFERLRALRPLDVNLNVAVSDRDGSADFHMTTPEYLSTFNRADVDRQVGIGYVKSFRTETIRTMTLASLLAAHAAGREIDFMTVDTEGAEALVFGGNDWARFKPALLVVEFVVSGRDTLAEWEHLVLAQGYRRERTVGCNVFYAR